MENSDIELNKGIYEESYSDKAEGMYEPDVELIEYIIRKYNLKSIVDFACGRGKIGMYLKEALNDVDYTIDAVEISENAAKIAAPYYDEIEIKFDYKLPGKKYDLVVLSSIIEHIYDKNLDILFNDIKEKLNEGGRVFILVPNVHSFIRTFVDDSEEDRIKNGHVNMKTKKGWIEYFKKHGFSDIQFTFPVKLKHKDRINYFSNNKMMNFFIKNFYNLFFTFPFYNFKDAFCILLGR